MNKSIPVLLSTLAVAGCMTSYPMWDPPPVETQTPVPNRAGMAVTVEGRVAEIDHDSNSIEVETSGEGAENWVTVELDDETTVFSSAARDESSRGDEGLDLLEEDDTISVSGTRRDDDTILAHEISLVGNEVTTTPKPAAPMFEPRSHVGGTVRSIDTSIGRFVLETDSYGMVAFYCDGDTPVFFNGVIYQIGNLEVGDGVEVTIGATDDGDPATPWVTAILVTRSVSHDGPPPPAKGDVGKVAEPDVKLDTIEIVGAVKRVEKQGFEIEDESGRLRYVTADGYMRTEDCDDERVGSLKAGVSVSVRALEIGDRVVAQKINCVEPRK